MTSRTIQRTGRLAALGIALGLAVNIGWAQTQSWNYKSYQRDKTTGLYNKEKFLTSTISLTEQDDDSGSHGHDGSSTASRTSKRQVAGLHPAPPEP